MLKTPVLVFLGILVLFGIIFFAMQRGTKTQNTNSAIIPSIAQSTATPIVNQQATDSATIDDMNDQTATTATITTSKGDITLSFFNDVAPNTVKNFVQKAQSGFYNNLTFHRVEDWVIQGGDPDGDGSGGGSKPVEFNNKPFVTGALGVASRGDGRTENDAQFFITKSDAVWLNGQYTNFGQVTEGMDVVQKIAVGDKILSITVE